MRDNMDDDAQPYPAINAKRVAERTIDELIGICKGVTCDGRVTLEEADFLRRWLINNRASSGQWPCNILFDRLTAMLKDGVLDSGETVELLQLLHQITGERPIYEQIANMSTSLPLDNPMPELSFNGHVFCFTGKFIFGTRRKCEEEVLARGGDVAGSVRKTLPQYLVIGVIGSRDWIHSTHGRKIEKAVALREEGNPVVIVSEEHWTKYL